MEKKQIEIGSIPAVIWGGKSDSVYLYVHGKLSNKESAEQLAEIAVSRGWQVISFDLPEHGERRDKEYKCDVWNGIRDLTEIGDYVFEKWRTVSLFAVSIGAFFSLHAYRSREFENCLFVSPIVDMEWLIHQMMNWFDVSEEQLAEKKEVETPVETLSWDYYRYIQENPIVEWPFPTQILYAAKDNLQSREVIEEFAQKFHCRLTVSENSEHPFMEAEDMSIVEEWMKRSL